MQPEIIELSKYRMDKAKSDADNQIANAKKFVACIEAIIAGKLQHE